MSFSVEAFAQATEAIGKGQVPPELPCTCEGGMLAVFPQTLHTPFVLSAPGNASSENEMKAICSMLPSELSNISIVNLGNGDGYDDTLLDIADDADAECLVSLRQLPSSCDCEVLVKGFADPVKIEAKLESVFERHGFSGIVEATPSSDGLPAANVNVKSELLDMSQPEACPNRIYDLLKELIFSLL